MSASLLDQAWEFHDRGELPQACEIYAEIVSADPQNAEAWFRFGAAVLSLNDPHTAAEYLDCAVRLGHVEAKNALAVALNNIGLTFFNKGNLLPALSFFERALIFSPNFPNALVNRGLCLIRLGSITDAKYRRENGVAEGIAAIERAVELNPNNPDFWVHLGNARRYQNHDQDAIHCFDHALALNPNHKRAAFFRQLVATQGPVAMPPELVASLFNVHAGDFEHLLVDILKYNTPARLYEKFIAVHPSAANLHILDLGCGTGLSGVAFQPVAASLTGVDLAQNMLDLAREKGIYASLHCMNILDALDTLGQFDLALAADVVIYLSDLDPLFAGAHKSLRPQGWFVFSTEHTTEADHLLTASSRFAHNPDYIARLARQYGFIPRSISRENIRMEAGLPVFGDLYVFQLP